MILNGERTSMGGDIEGVNVKEEGYLEDYEMM